MELTYLIAAPLVGPVVLGLEVLHLLKLVKKILPPIVHQRLPRVLEVLARMARKNGYMKQLLPYRLALVLFDSATLYVVEPMG